MLRGARYPATLPPRDAIIRRRRPPPLHRDGGGFVVVVPAEEHQPDVREPEAGEDDEGEGADSPQPPLEFGGEVEVPRDNVYGAQHEGDPEEQEDLGDDGRYYGHGGFGPVRAEERLSGIEDGKDPPFIVRYRVELVVANLLDAGTAGARVAVQVQDSLYDIEAFLRSALDGDGPCTILRFLPPRAIRRKCKSNKS